ncbi:DUF2269 family protein [Thalassolituus hydrocarboniclasticus]|uniref:DUF2269 domain-containing protein n=1 Tax=Thalassolituus hydrocarboniclasticus TaxID=2742796 RepID=A0ABY6AE43_9GAMM|nr:DUF2269 domain-containing protein [Thalassolituus hydrocarboniclasticus]UXD88120.1 DUF2269 domain-containing protein [Thalassolituus hydrocarboniclasticus]
MTDYFLLKTLHILSAVVLMGTGSGIAFFMLMAVLSRSQETIRHVSRIVILADWLFTAPAVVVQLLSGLLLMSLLNVSFTSPWFLTVAALFILIGCCWLPVVWIQYQLHREACMENGFLSVRFKRLMRLWIALGIPAFAAMLVLFWLMVAKPLAVI